jgi:gas vesicle protein
MAEKEKINFRIEISMKQRWDDFCKTKDITFTDLIKNSVHEYMKRDVKGDVTTTILSKLEDVRGRKQEAIEERDSIVSQLNTRIARMEELMNKIVGNATATTDDKAKVVALIKHPYSSKSIGTILNMDSKRVMTVLKTLKESNLAKQNENMEWVMINGNTQ